MHIHRFRAVAIAVVATFAALQAAAIPPATAGTAQAQVVNAVPAVGTPDVKDGVVLAINQVGTRVIVGGRFTTVAPHGSSATYRRPNIFAFDAASGAIDTGFHPALDGQVQGIEPGPIANTVYVSGFFGHVNGVASKSITLLNATTGAIVAGFKPAVMNGAGWAVAYANGRLFVGGTFSTVGGVAHRGLVSLDPRTGALTSFVTVQLADHHNYNGSGADGAVGPRAMAVSPDGDSLIVIGNFKHADGDLHDQIVWIDLSGSTARVRPDWNTSQYTAACFNTNYDTYMRGVDWAPDGSYFVVTATGGSGTNTDGTRALCDSAARFELSSAGADVRATWVDFSGQDTLLSAAITGTAVYVGGHQRWLNNSKGFDYPGTGAVPRPGLAALDPANGLPLKWNPGRNPRGAGAYAMFASADGLYVGSDTEYFGDHQYLHQRLGFFPLAGGTSPASTATTPLPADVYQTGPLAKAPNSYSYQLGYRPFDGSTAGARTVVLGTGVDWSDTRGAFMAGNTLYWGTSNGTFYQATFDGSALNAPVAVDPYNDPAWSNVQTGSGQTYRGTPTAYYSQLISVTAAFYSGNRLYYSLSGDAVLHYRYFTPDSGIVGSDQFDVPGGDFSAVSGAFVSGSTLFYASRADGTLHETSFAGSVVSGPDTVVSGPGKDGIDWRARSLFVYARPGTGASR